MLKVTSRGHLVWTSTPTINHFFLILFRTYNLMKAINIECSLSWRACIHTPFYAYKIGGPLPWINSVPTVRLLVLVVSGEVLSSEDSFKALIFRNFNPKMWDKRKMFVRAFGPSLILMIYTLLLFWQVFWIVMERLGITCKFQMPRDRLGIDALLMVPEQLPKIIC